MDRVVDTKRARQNLGAMLDGVRNRGDTVTIERHGKPMAVLVPVDFVEARKRALIELEKVAAQNRQDNADVDDLDDLVLEAVVALRG